MVKKLTIICLPKRPFPQEVATDSIIRSCSVCGCEVWLSPVGQGRVKDGASLMCEPCARDRVEPFDLIEIPESVRQEVETHLGRPFKHEETQELLRRWLQGPD